MGNIDDLFRQMEEDDLADKVEFETKATPREYAAVRGLAPQQVYYRIRNNKLKVERCICGRKVIDIKAADEVFGFTDDSADEEKEDGSSTEVDWEED